MCKKSIFLISLILLLGLANNVYAPYDPTRAILWDGGGGDDLWTTPENWVSDVMPGSGDTTRPTINNPTVAQPLVDSGVTANNTHRIITIGADSGPVSLTITGGSLTATTYFIVGWEAGGVGTVNMSGGSLNPHMLMVACRGTGTVNLSGGDITVNDRLFVGEESAEAVGEGTLNMSGGTIYTGNQLYVSRGISNGILNMTGGLINTERLIISPTALATGEVNLYGGTVYIRQSTSSYLTMTDYARINITEGKLVINGDVTDPSSELMANIGNGHITAYNGAGILNVNFVDPNTVVTATALYLSIASEPIPAHEATDVPRDVVLKWTPGVYAPPANGHKVYFSYNFDDVNIGAPGADRGLTTTPEFDSADLPFVLDFNTTYYWRIDEANSVIGWDQGDVWQFTTEPFAYPIADIIATASSYEAGKGPENTTNGSGLDDDLHSMDMSDMWLSAGGGPQPTWICYEFHKLYKLHEMWVWNYNGEGLNTAYGLRDVSIEYSSDGANWMQLVGVPEFDRALGTPDYAHNTTVNLGGVVAKYVKITANRNWSGGLVDQYGLSEVCFYYIPVRTREPNPGLGASSVGPEAVLSWRAGREAAMHELYLDTNEQAVKEGTITAISIPATETEVSYGPLSLELAQIYYWKVNEVNMVETPSAWEGDVWNFTTPNYLTVDDMESYGGADTPGQAGGRIWYTWKDGEGWTDPSPGYGGNGTGSVIGNLNWPYIEQGVVHEGRQSMPYCYDNDGTNVLGTPGKAYYSEVTASTDDLAIGSDWTKGGAKALSLWFYVDPNNDADETEQMYVKLNGAKIDYDGDMNDVRQASWHEWNIDLTEFGIALSNVTEITIGFGIPTDTTTQGGSGKVYFDDIVLRPSRCFLSRRLAGLARADYIEDCVVDHRELAEMARNWLLAAAPSDANLVVHYRFEDNFNDSSSYTAYHHGEPRGDPTFDSGRVGNRAVNLDGDDYVDCKNPGALNFGTDNWSICAWVKTAQFDAAATVFANGGDESGGIRYTLAIGEGGPDGVVTLTTDDDATKTQAISSTLVNDNEWHHVVGQRDGTTLRVYVDTTPDGAATVPAGYDLSGASQHNAYVGTITDHRDPTGNTLEKFLVGLIDDVRIYDYALSWAEISYLASLPVDLNSDTKVDFKDYAILAELWLEKQLWP